MRKMNPLLLSASILLLAACNTRPSAQEATKPTPISQAPNDTTVARQWLVKVIEQYTNNEDLNAAHDSLRKALTDDYYAYKLDALNLGYDSGDTLTEAGFQQKWKHKYNTANVGEGGFIISAQDNGLVKVKSCTLLKQPAADTIWYKVVIEDLDLGGTYTRDFKLIKRDAHWFIDDVVEYD
jgi:hypothetical protein